MEYRDKHNQWLNKGENESNEEYNERIANFERKASNMQFISIVVIEQLQMWVAQEKQDDIERDKNIPDRNPDFVNGFRLALEMFAKKLESEKANREVIMNDPTKYELKLVGKSYKLSKRK